MANEVKNSMPAVSTAPAVQPVSVPTNEGPVKREMAAEAVRGQGWKIYSPKEDKDQFIRAGQALKAAGMTLEELAKAGVFMGLRVEEGTTLSILEEVGIVEEQPKEIGSQIPDSRKLGEYQTDNPYLRAPADLKKAA